MDLHLWLLHPERAMCDAFERRAAGLPGVRVIQGAYPEIEPHDCFVTPGNAFGLMTDGVDAAVVRFFGEPLARRVRQRIRRRFLGEQPVGTAFILDTGNARYPFVCHAPTMRLRRSIAGTDQVYAAAWAALLAVHDFNRCWAGAIRTLAMPALGTGAGAVPFDESARQIAAAWRHYLDPPASLDWDVAAEREKAIRGEEQPGSRNDATAQRG